MSNPAYEAAKQPGGKHHGHYLRYRDEGVVQLNRAIRSLEKQIAEHQQKIDHPDQVDGYASLAPRRQDYLRNTYWPQEIENYREQVDILYAILDERGKP
jgi:hypothetical protein